jgi:hypothetical protein
MSDLSDPTMTLPPLSENPVLRLVYHRRHGRTYPRQLPKALSTRLVASVGQVL